MFNKMENSKSSTDLNLFIQENQMKIAGPGNVSKNVESILSKLIGTKSTFLTPSGTAALEMIAILLDIKPGDEVIMPSWTFSSTATSFILRGAKIIFVDVELDSLNMNPIGVEKAISRKTKAIVTINYGGIPGDIESLSKLAKERNVHFVEDNAHGFGGSINGKSLGSFGELSALSFHQTKNLQCGEGGALTINEIKFSARAEIIREKGTDRSSFIRGEIDKYTWRDIGSSFVISEILAKYLQSNLEEFESNQSKRRATWKTYENALKGWAENIGAKVPVHDVSVIPACHAFWVLLPNPEVTLRFIDYMKKHSIGVSRHYVPLHSAPAALKYSCTTHGDMDNTNLLGEQLVRLPMYSSLSNDQVTRIVETVGNFK